VVRHYYELPAFRGRGTIKPGAGKIEPKVRLLAGSAFDVRKGLLRIVLVLMTALGVVTSAAAHDDAPFIWVDRSRSIAGAKVIEVMPVTDESGTGIPAGRLVEIQQAIQQVLEASGTFAEASTLAPGTPGLRLQTLVTSLKTGDAVGRWVGFGAGAAKCTIRARLFEPGSSRAVAEIISTRVVDSGGFFTLGVDTRIHRDLAHDVGKALAEVLATGGSKP
jgi:hypothetical protein